jgi:hypothetical protein
MDVFEEHYILDATDVGVSYRIFDLSGSDKFPAMRQLAVYLFIYLFKSFTKYGRATATA